MLIGFLGQEDRGGHSNPLQYSCLENPINRGTWWVTVHRVTKSQTQLKQLSTHACFINNEFLFNKCFIIMCQTCFSYNLVASFSSVQFISVAQSCPALCDPMNCSTPGLPVHHQLPGFTQTHVLRVRDIIQSSHPLSSPSPGPNPSQHQSLFQ